MLKPSERPLLGMSKRSFQIALTIVLLGFLIGVTIEFFQWLCAVDFFKGSGLIQILREYHFTLAWIRFFAFAVMIAGMAFGFTKWLRYEVYRHRDGTD